jgi:hypothetical protein
MIIEGTCTTNDKTKYNSGETPKIGDEIIAINSSYESFGKGSTFSVIDIVTSSTSIKVKLQCIKHIKSKAYYASNYNKGDKFPHSFQANNFKLNKSYVGNALAVNKDDKTKSVKYIVLNSKGTLVATADNNKVLEDVVSKLLVKSPFDQYRVFTYEKLAKAPKIEVQWENA